MRGKTSVLIILLFGILVIGFTSSVDAQAHADTIVDVNGTEYLEFDDAIVITLSSTTEYLEFDDAIVITSSSTTSNDREIRQMYQICYAVSPIQEKHMCIKERYWEFVNQYLEFVDAIVITSSSTTSNEIIELPCNRFDIMCMMERYWENND